MTGNKSGGYINQAQISIGPGRIIDRSEQIVNPCTVSDTLPVLLTVKSL